MADAVNTNGPDRATAACPNCGTRVAPRAQDVGRSVECPECFVPVSVPLDFVVPPPVPVKTRRVSPRAAQGQPAGKTPPQRPAQRMPKQRQIECAGCRTRFQVPVRKSAYETECLVCSEVVRVPGWAERRGPKEEPTDGADTKPQQPAATVFDRMAEIRVVDGPPPPRWTFFSGVFTMPWHPEAVVRWLYLSFGFFLWAIAGTGTLVCALGSGPMFYGTFFFGKAFLWLTILVLGYAGSCFLAIIGDTEHGLDRIENWPDPFWIDWFFDLLRIAAIEMTVLAIGYGVGAAVCLATDHRPEPFLGSFWTGTARPQLPFLVPMAVTEFLLFPIALLSTMETGSLWTPYSGPILRSLGKVWWGWLLFFALASSLDALLFLIGLCWGRFPWETSLLAGPIIPAVLMVYARLLGRLAWKINRVL